MSIARASEVCGQESDCKGWVFEESCFASWQGQDIDPKCRDCVWGPNCLRFKRLLLQWVKQSEKEAGPLSPTEYLYSRNTSSITFSRAGVVQSLWARRSWDRIAVGLRDFPHQSLSAMGVHPNFYKIGTGSLSWWMKRPGCGVNHPPKSMAEDK